MRACVGGVSRCRRARCRSRWASPPSFPRAAGSSAMRTLKRPSPPNRSSRATHRHAGCSTRCDAGRSPCARRTSPRRGRSATPLRSGSSSPCSGKAAAHGAGTARRCSTCRRRRCRRGDRRTGNSSIDPRRTLLESVAKHRDEAGRQRPYGSRAACDGARRPAGATNAPIGGRTERSHRARGARSDPARPRAHRDVGLPASPRTHRRKDGRRPHRCVGSRETENRRPKRDSPAATRQAG